MLLNIYVYFLISQANLQNENIQNETFDNDFFKRTRPKAIETKSFQICQKARTVLLQKLHANHYIIVRLEDKMVRMEDDTQNIAPLVDHIIKVRQMLDPCFLKTKAYDSLQRLLTVDCTPRGL